MYRLITFYWFQKCHPSCNVLHSALQTDFDTIWQNSIEEHIEQVHVAYYCRSVCLTWPSWPARDVNQSVLCIVYSVLNDADDF